LSIGWYNDQYSPRAVRAISDVYNCHNINAMMKAENDTYDADDDYNIMNESANENDHDGLVLIVNVNVK